MLASLIGTLPNWLTVVALLGAVWVFYRGGGGAAIQTLQVANQVLEKNAVRLESRVKELEEQTRLDGNIIAELRTKTDVAAQLHPIVEWTKAHEKADQTRFDHTLQVLEQIAAHLGKDHPTAE